MPATPDVLQRPHKDQLGETPFWDEETQQLYWCDIVGKRVQRLDPATGSVEHWAMPDFVTGVVPTTSGDVAVMLMDGVYRVALGEREPLDFARPDTDPRNRCNEVRTDPQGRLWLGTMGSNIGPNGEDIDQPQGALGSVFCVEANGFARRVLGGIGITNTFCWSPDGEFFYTADTKKRVIWRFRYDADDAVLHDRQVFIDGDIAPGNPDGASMDEEGCLWGARWGGGQFVRYTPAGRIDRTIDLPAKQPSSCAFGGRDRKTLYITTARQGQDDLAPDALDGSLFVLPVDVAGLPMPRFKA